MCSRFVRPKPSRTSGRQRRQTGRLPFRGAAHKCAAEECGSTAYRYEIAAVGEGCVAKLAMMPEGVPSWYLRPTITMSSGLQPGDDCRSHTAAGDQWLKVKRRGHRKGGIAPCRPTRPPTRGLERTTVVADTGSKAHEGRGRIRGRG